MIGMPRRLTAGDIRSGLPLPVPFAPAIHAVFFIAPALLYFLTAARDPGWGDAAMIVSQASNPDLGSWVDTHSLFDLLGFLWLRLFPAGNVFFHLVLLSALFGVLAVYGMFQVVLELTGELISAGFAALVLMVSHSLWWHSTMVEVYTLNSAIMTAMLVFLFRYDRTGAWPYLGISAFFCGLGITNHVLMGLFLFAYVALAIFLAVRPRPKAGKAIGLAILFLIAGAGFYIFLFFRDVSRAVPAHAAPAAWMRDFWAAFRSTLSDATVGHFGSHMFSRGLPARLMAFWRINYAFLLFCNFPTPALAMGITGIWAFWKMRSSRLSFFFFVTAMAAQAVWSSNYFVWDMYAFIQPVCVLLCIPVGLCARRLLQSPRALRTAFLVLIVPMIAFPPFLYSRMSSFYRSVGFLHRFLDTYPTKAFAAHTYEPVEYVANPIKRAYDKVELYARALFAALPPNSHFLDSDARADYPLRYYYQERLHERTDIIYNSLWSPAITEHDARSEALQLKHALDRGEPVFAASIEMPERLVLDQLFLLNDPGADLEFVREMPAQEYVERFPGIDLQRIVFSEPDEIWIYRLAPRPH